MTTDRGQQLRGRRPGDVRVRLARRRTQEVELPQTKVRRPVQPSVFYLIGGFAALIAVGTLLLWLPVASRAPGSVDIITALFTATSAVCVTGLAVVDTRDTWTTFGQVVILALIQLGGLGFMTSSTLLVMLLGRRISVRQRVVMAGTFGALAAVPPGTLVRRIVLATLAVEAVGAVLLAALFTYEAGVLDAGHLWRGVFVAVSAFNNAGFDIEGGFRSLIDHRENEALLLVVATLILAGSTGYAVWWDVVTKRSWARLGTDTKIVLSASAVLIALGAFAMLLFEAMLGATLTDTSIAEGGVASLFMSVSLRTAGFTVVDLSAAHDSTLLVFMGLMFIGGAPVSTAGGIKVTTFTVLLFAIIAAVSGRQQVAAFGRAIPASNISRALSVALLAVAIVFSLTLALSMANEGDLVDVAFEAVSAFGTVGLSTGLTPQLSETSSRILVAVVMFIGRLGPLSFALALAGQLQSDRVRYPEEHVAMG